MFNPKGQSPLIVHFLRMKQLREKPAQPAVTDGAMAQPTVTDGAMVPISENKALTLAKTPRDIGLKGDPCGLSTSLSELPGEIKSNLLRFLLLLLLLYLLLYNDIPYSFDEIWSQ